MIPDRSYELHSIHCERFLYRCIECSELIPKSCRAEHDIEKHTKVTCTYCQDSLAKDTLSAHMNRCEFRPQPCRFCQAEFAMVCLIEHQEECGNRTDICMTCHKYVQLKDFANHVVVECTPDTHRFTRKPLHEVNQIVSDSEDKNRSDRKRRASDEDCGPSKRFKNGY